MARQNQATERGNSARHWNYPYDAVEEALVNAVYHKSYSKPEPIVVTFTPEQMTITSIPGPDRSIKTADLKRLCLLSKGDRNRRIGEFLKELDLAKARNTGYPVILSATEKNGSPKPVLETNSHRDFFTFVLPIHKMFLRADAETVRELNPTESVSDPVSDPVDSRVVSLFEALADGPLTAANLRAKLSVSHRKFFTGCREWVLAGCLVVDAVRVLAIDWHWQSHKCEIIGLVFLRGGDWFSHFDKHVFRYHTVLATFGIIHAYGTHCLISS